MQLIVRGYGLDWASAMSTPLVRRKDRSCRLWCKGEIYVDKSSNETIQVYCGTCNAHVNARIVGEHVKIM